MVLRLMLADDERGERDYLEKVIKESYPTLLEVVCKASNGIELMEQIEECKPQIILLDIKMPQMDGLETAGQIRKICPDVQIIIVSAYGDFEYAKQAMKLGISEYLLKPYMDSELRAVLDRAIIRIREKKDTLAMLSYSGDKKAVDRIYDRDSEKDILWDVFFDREVFDKKLFKDKMNDKNWLKVAVISTSVLSHMGEFSKKVLENYFSLPGVEVFNTIWMNQMAICLFSEKKEAFSELNSCIRRARNYLVQEHHIPVVCGVSGVYQGIECLGTAYNEATSFILEFSEANEKQQFMDQTAYMKKIRVLEKEIIESIKGKDKRESQEKMLQLVEILETALDYHDVSVKLNFGRSMLTILRGVNQDSEMEIAEEEIQIKLRKLEQLNFNGDSLKDYMDFFSDVNPERKA